VIEHSLYARLHRGTWRPTRPNRILAPSAAAVVAGSPNYSCTSISLAMPVAPQRGM